MKKLSKLSFSFLAVSAIAHPLLAQHTLDNLTKPSISIIEEPCNFAPTLMMPPVFEEAEEVIKQFIIDKRPIAEAYSFKTTATRENIASLNPSSFKKSQAAFTSTNFAENQEVTKAHALLTLSLEDFSNALETYPISSRLVIIEEGDAVFIKPSESALGTANKDQENQKIMRMLKDAITARYSFAIANNIPDLNPMAFVSAKDLSSAKLHEVFDRLDGCNAGTIYSETIPRLRGGRRYTYPSIITIGERLLTSDGGYLYPAVRGRGYYQNILYSEHAVDRMAIDNTTNKNIIRNHAIENAKRTFPRLAQHFGREFNDSSLRKWVEGDKIINPVPEELKNILLINYTLDEVTELLNNKYPFEHTSTDLKIAKFCSECAYDPREITWRAVKELINSNSAIHSFRNDGIVEITAAPESNLNLRVIIVENTGLVVSVFRLSDDDLAEGVSDVDDDEW
ncbi:MAG TPA: hypothetical protein VJK54_05355 [Chthoniobacterales bacterium]|nr:hypothetical protein [Chthoniobacterales bacterium]